MRMLTDDRGNATVTTTGIIAALVGLLFVVHGAFHAVLADHRARLAADLSAVAGAWAHAYGENACAAAGETARLNHAELTECTADGNGDVTVTADVDGREVTARAGPV